MYVMYVYLQVSWGVYNTYMKAMGRKAVTIGLVFVLASIGLQVTSYIWLSKWTGDKIFLNASDATNNQKESAMQGYLVVMSVIGIGQGESPLTADS